MVEGPGCKLKGIKIKAKLKGQTVKDVKGNAVDKFKKKGTEGVSPFHQLIGRKLEDVQTLGKELFMYFGDLCLRVHFLMSGQSFINNEKVDSELGGKAETASLELLMTQDLLTFKKSSVDIRPSQPCKQKYEELNDLDICSPVFNFRRALDLVRAQQERLVCDVLLDQTILPGVGNIIKNEALFDSGIKPSSKISELKDEHISHLIKMTRDFTDIFYKCRRDGKPLYPYYKIYSKRKCGQCEGKVTICRVGDDNDRVTYFCETCQTNELKVKERKLPVKGSLIGWVKTGKDVEASASVDWSCNFCTLINKASSLTCTACLNPRSGSDNTASSGDGDCILIDENQKPLATVTRKRPVNEDVNTEHPLKTRKLNSGRRCVSIPKTEVSKPKHNSFRKQPAVNLPQAQTNKNLTPVSRLQSSALNISGTLDNKQILSSGYNIHSKQGVSTKSQSQVSRQQTTVGNNQSQQASQNVTGSKIPLCNTHNRKCNLKEVRKEGNNLGRWFFSCVVRNCNFFEWADVKFPLCPDHGKPCTIRTVMKIGPNNGRKFFACKMPRNKQCKFFEWADGYDE